MKKNISKGLLKMAMCMFGIVAMVGNGFGVMADQPEQRIESEQTTENTEGSEQNTENTEGSEQNTENAEGSEQNTENTEGSEQNTENTEGSEQNTENTESTEQNTESTEQTTENQNYPQEQTTPVKFQVTDAAMFKVEDGIIVDYLGHKEVEETTETSEGSNPSTEVENTEAKTEATTEVASTEATTEISTEVATTEDSSEASTENTTEVENTEVKAEATTEVASTENKLQAREVATDTTEATTGSTTDTTEATTGSTEATTGSTETTTETTEATTEVADSSEEKEETQQPKKMKKYEEVEQVETIVVPAEIDGQKIVGIGDQVFDSCVSLKTVVLPNTIKSIDNRAFAFCKVLSEMYCYDEVGQDGQVEVQKKNTQFAIMNLPAQLESLADDSLLSCPAVQCFAVDESNETFKTFSAVEGRTKEGELLMSKDGTILYRMAANAFSGNGKYEIPETVKEIGGYALQGNMGGGRSYVIPTSVEKIGNYAFYGCNNLNAVEFTAPSSVTEIGDYAFASNDNISNDTGVFTLPESVRKIGESCFRDCRNMVVDISNTNIESIPQLIFFGCVNIHDVVLPKSLRCLEAYAFAGSDNLNSITFLGDSLEKIGTGAFKGCNNLHEIVVPEGVKAIENDTFNECWNLNKIILPDSLEVIGDNAFKDCQNIKEMQIPENVKQISNSSFTGAKQDAIDTSKNEIAKEMFSANTSKPETTQELPKPTAPTTQATTEKVDPVPAKGQVIVVGGVKYKVTVSDATKGTVAVCGVTSKKIKKVTVKNTITSGKYTFAVTEVSKNAFKKCTKLKSAVIGANVTKIGANAFAGDKKLSKITIKSKKLKSVGKNAIKGISAKATIKAPKKQLAKYKKLFKKKTGFKDTMKIKK